MPDRKAATSILEQISAALTEFATEAEYPGLLGGYTGSALFFAYYYQLTGDESHLDKAYAVIQRSLDAVATTSVNGSHCSGLSGIAWTLLHLSQMGLIEEDDLNETFEETDQLLAEWMDLETAQHRFDFLHQGLGVALYFLNRLPSPVARKQLEKLVMELDSQKYKLGQGVAWKDLFSSLGLEKEDRPLFNLGLAHGNPAIISILARIYEKNIAQDIVRPMVHQAVNWLISTRKTNQEAGNSLFPVLVDEHHVMTGSIHSRLGWCYGDLGIACALWDAGSRMDVPAWKEYAFEIFTHIATYRDAENGTVLDACLCHGSAGIAVILQQAGINANDSMLLQNAEHWWETAVTQNTFADGPAGYKFYHHPQYVDSHNMLEGICGIGLSLITFVAPEIKPAWAESLLIV
ncbi:lanthionine synthetase C family protein [Chitinophaga sp. sic0106]|uniref:lanthionine synthetase C family protein n=1 Tax=Chitinophaga sp. sic0106 TaxID=2854785 RepID=UPI001C443773|nr:lanthionine synthetase C family protein [Chitinophaga sp. sic0106]MBV7530710.1 lanthionine synthetase C family protein [Chitinophaga sp. sic0106]